MASTSSRAAAGSSASGKRPRASWSGPWGLSLGRPGGAGLRPGWAGSLLAAHPDGEIILHNSELWRLARDEARWPGAQDTAPPPELPPAYRISYAACSPDSKFAVTDRRGLGQLWDLATGVPFQVPLVGRANGLVLSPDGTKLVGALAESPGSPRSCRVWDNRGKPLSPILTHANQIGSLAFSPDSKLLAVGTYAWSVHLYDSATGKPRGQALMQNDIVQSLAFSPDSKMLAAGTATDWNHAPQTRLADVKTG